MNDTLLGIIIGGAIGVIPTLITLYINVWQEHSRQKHQFRMVRIELYEKSKLDAIQAYSKMAGALMSDGVGSEFGIDRYLSSLQNVCLFVTDEARKAILDFHNILLSGWRIGDLVAQKDQNKPLTKEYEALCDALYKEIRTTWNQ